MTNFLKSSSFKVCILLFFTLLVGVITFGKVKLGGYDEQLYLFFMNTLDNKGIEGIRLLIQEFPTSEILLQGPSPLRILFPLTGVFIGKLFPVWGMENLALIAFASWVGVVIFSFYLFQKWFTPTIATLSGLLIIASPLGIALSRRALQDTFASFIFIGIIFFYHQYWLRRKIADLFLFTVFLTAGFLTKESTILLYPCLITVGLYYRKSMPGALPRKIIIPLIIAPLLYLIISSYIAGSFKNYFDHYKIYSKMQNTIEYAVRFQKGPWFRYIIDLLLLSPLTYIFSMIGMLALIPDKHNQIGRSITTIYVFSGLAVFSFLPILNLRIILFIDVFLRALSVLGILYISEKINTTKFKYIFVILLFSLIIILDINQFYKLFIKSAIYDPITINLISANGFIK